MAFRNAVVLCLAAVLICITPIVQATRSGPSISQEFIVFSEDDPVALEELPQAVEEEIVVTVGRLEEYDKGFPVHEDSDNHPYGEGNKFIEEFEVLDENEARLNAAIAWRKKARKAGTLKTGATVVSASGNAWDWLNGKRSSRQ